jgi:uncharacterized membrane protein YccF (DUF307 family)
MSSNVVIEKNKNPGCLIQILWFALVGVWLGEIWIAVAWFLMVTIIGIPIAVKMLNKLPKVIALREEPVEVLVTKQQNGQLTAREIDRPQVNIILRAIYFVLIGWWMSALWMEAAYAVCLTIIGLPLGFWMFDRVPAVVSLKR